MAVTVAHRRIGAHHVDVAAALDVPQLRALAARQHDRQRIVIVGRVAVLECDGVHGRLRHKPPTGADHEGQYAPKLLFKYGRLVSPFPPKWRPQTAEYGVSGGTHDKSAAC